jgi:hypothetical protein
MDRLSGTNFIYLNGTMLTVLAGSVPEKKLAMKEIKFKKKEMALQKRSITDQQKIIRATYTQNTRFRRSTGPGGGQLGQAFRTIERNARDRERAHLARGLAPLEEQKQRLDAMILALDNLALQLEQQILSSGL